jgi:putative ABC transport system permease protein
VANFNRTPLAWKNLTHDVKRLLVATAGVGFAVILMFMELGFWGALLESTVQVLRKADGEIFLVGSGHYSLISGERFDARALQRAQQVTGVKSAKPIYMEGMGGLLRRDGSLSRPIRVIAVDWADSPLQIGNAKATAEAIAAPRTALADAQSRGKYQLTMDGPFLLNDTPLSIAGHFELGIDFSTDGNLLMSSNSFAEYFPFRAGGADPLQKVDIGVVKLEPSTDARTVVKELNHILAPGVIAYTRDELIGREKHFWQTNAPLGYIFMVGAIMGFIVGVVICYQIIYSDINDHMREFATLKAMGYRAPFFRELVFRQSLYMAGLGFVPGLIVSWMGYELIRRVTGLTLHLDLTTAATVFVATASMCSISGFLAVGKLLSSDPAELF